MAGRPGYYLSRNPRHTVIGAIRGALRLPLFLTTFFAITFLSVMPRALMPGGWYRDNGWKARRLLGRLLCLSGGVRITRHGRPPRDASLVVSNHLSWMDSFVLAAELGSRFVANHVYGQVPVVGTVLRLNGILFIDRTRLEDAALVGKRLFRSLHAGDPVVIYPEAVTTMGEDVRPFRGALLEPLAHAGTPVHWVALRYQTPPGWPPAAVVLSWADWTPLILHIYRALHLPGIDVTLHYGRNPVTASNRKTLATALHEEVSRVFVPQDQMDPEDLKRIWVDSPEPLPAY